MDNRRVSMLFCGGCNPRIRRVLLANALAQCLEEQGYRTETNQLDVDFVIYISGCESGCARRYQPSLLPSVTVAGLTVDAMTMNFEDMTKHIAEKVGEYFAKLEDTVPR